SASGRHGDDRRHDPGRAEDRARRPVVPAREEGPGVHDGLEPLQGRHAALRRTVSSGEAQARRDDHAPWPPRGRQRGISRDEGRRGGALGPDVQLGTWGPRHGPHQSSEGGYAPLGPLAQRSVRPGEPVAHLKYSERHGMATYVLIHGAYQGGWIWKPVAT